MDKFSQMHKWKIKMSHELRNFEEGFKEGKIAGLKMAQREYFNLESIEQFSQWIEKQIEELENAK